MSIFLKRMEDITIEDIDVFIREKHPENIRLEYKSGFSSTSPNTQIAKEVSSFANQQGGILLYGVTEKEGEARCPDCIVGVDKSLSPGQKIQSVCIDHIYPPVTPEIQEFELKNGSNKVVVMVRIEMSESVPHTINNRTGFYVRVHDRCDPREMSDEEIKLLMNRREKLVERREWLMHRTYNRVFPRDVKRNYMLTPAILMAVPLYPFHSLTKREDLYDKYRASEVSGGQGFPLETDRIKTASDSIYSYISSKEGDTLTVRKERYGELNIFGGIAHFENAIHNFNQVEGIFLGYELRKLFLMVKFAGNFYKNLGFWGVIKFILKVENCRGVRLIFPRDWWGYNDELAIMELDTNINIERECSVSELTDDAESFSANIFQEYIWNIGLSVHRVNQMPVGYWLDKTKIELFGSKLCPKCNKVNISKIDSICRDCGKN